eukprot:5637132-Pyramimonas_sp.AAC.2
MEQVEAPTMPELVDMLAHGVEVLPVAQEPPEPVYKVADVDELLTSASPVPSHQLLTSASPVPSHQLLTSASPDPSNQLLTSASPVPSHQLLTSASPVPSHQLLTSASPDPSDEHFRQEGREVREGQ